MEKKGVLIVFGLEMVQQVLQQTNLLKVQGEDCLQPRNLSQICPCDTYSVSFQGLLNKPHELS